MYQIEELLKFSGLVHGFSTKADGNMSFKFGKREEVIKNREKFLSDLGIKLDSCVALVTQHKDEIVIANRSLAGRGIREAEEAIPADGLITKEKNLYLFLLIADCLPIIMYDPKKEVVEIIHAGWKSTKARIALKAINKFKSEFNCEVQNIYVAIGPAIHKESYKFKDPAQRQLEDWKPYLKDLPNGETAIDLIGYNVKQLKDAGVLPENIFVSDIDIAKSNNYFSHYRDSQRNPDGEGRFACVAGAKTI